VLGAVEAHRQADRTADRIAAGPVHALVLPRLPPPEALRIAPRPHIAREHRLRHEPRSSPGPRRPRVSRTARG
jgi:hypothetical protein